MEGTFSVLTHRLAPIRRNPRRRRTLNLRIPSALQRPRTFSESPGSLSSFSVASFYVASLNVASFSVASFSVV
jgi:hypothetical protein